MPPPIDKVNVEINRNRVMTISTAQVFRVASKWIMEPLTNNNLLVTAKEEFLAVTPNDDVYPRDALYTNYREDSSARLALPIGTDSLQGFSYEFDPHVVNSTREVQHFDVGLNVFGIRKNDGVYLTGSPTMEFRLDPRKWRIHNPPTMKILHREDTFMSLAFTFAAQLLEEHLENLPVLNVRFNIRVIEPADFVEYYIHASAVVTAMLARLVVNSEVEESIRYLFEENGDWELVP